MEGSRSGLYAEAEPASRPVVWSPSAVEWIATLGVCGRRCFVGGNLDGQRRPRRDVKQRGPNQADLMKSTLVIVNDKMQRGYSYELSTELGKNFDPGFTPDLIRYKKGGARFPCSAEL